MFEIVEMVKTKDGSLFNDEKQAEYYVTDQLCGDINEILKTIELYSLQHRDLCAILTSLVGTVENAKRLASILNKHI